MLDATSQALVYVYAREAREQADIAKVPTLDDARRIVVNVAKLPALPAAWWLRTTGFTFQARRPTKIRRRRSTEGQLLLSWQARKVSVPCENSPVVVRYHSTWRNGKGSAAAMLGQRGEPSKGRLR